MDRLILLISAVTLVFATGCRKELQSGDLMFGVGGDSEFSEAITGATAWGDSIGFDHVGIIEVADGGNIFVIEASPRNGVRRVELEEFLSSVRNINGNPGVVVKRLKVNFPIAETIGRAKSHIGEEYDWWYLPDNGRMYCSELVYESYRDENGNAIFETRPMNFRTADGSIPEFWLKLFAEIGEDIPEGVAGTNPTDMSKDSRLEEVMRYF